jgi:hypothetical protein
MTASVHNEERESCIPEPRSVCRWLSNRAASGKLRISKARVTERGWKREEGSRGCCLAGDWCTDRVIRRLGSAPTPYNSAAAASSPSLLHSRPLLLSTKHEALQIHNHTQHLRTTQHRSHADLRKDAHRQDHHIGGGVIRHYRQRQEQDSGYVAALIVASTQLTRSR